MAWVALAARRPTEGAWVLMYLTRDLGVDRYRAGLYLGPDAWLSAANAYELARSTGGGQLRDADVSHWQDLPAPPGDAG